MPELKDVRVEIIFNSEQKPLDYFRHKLRHNVRIKTVIVTKTNVSFCLKKCIDEEVKLFTENLVKGRDVKEIFYS